MERTLQIQVRSSRVGRDGYRAGLSIPTQSGAIMVMVDLPAGLLSRLAAQYRQLHAMLEEGVNGPEPDWQVVGDFFGDLGNTLLHAAGPVLGFASQFIPGVGPLISPAVRGLTDMATTAIDHAIHPGQPGGPPAQPQGQQQGAQQQVPMARAQVSAAPQGGRVTPVATATATAAPSTPLKGTISTIHAATAGTLQPRIAAPLIGAANVASQALARAQDGDFGNHSQEVANILRTALRTLDARAGAAMGDPAAREALTRARIHVENRAAHALRAAEEQPQRSVVKGLRVANALLNIGA